MMPPFNTIIGKDKLIAKDFLEKGELAAIPTETVYGLAGNALNEDTVLKIFTAKNRPHFDPLIVHTHSIEEIEKYVQAVPAKALKLMEAFMPGPLTVLLPKKTNIPDLVTSGLDEVAIRIPQHPLTLELLKSLPFPLAAPSANPFGYISPTTAQHVYDQLQGKIPYILDGGPCHIGLESTIIGFEKDNVVVYRLGGLPVEQIENLVGPVVVAPQKSANPHAPGMLPSHYAPKKKLIFGNTKALQDDSTDWPGGNKKGIIAFDTPVEGVSADNQVILSPTGNLNEAAKNLFAAMRRLDASDVDVIYAVEFPSTGLGRAINDRLKRASA
ncbi:MAG TPA: L-threonylcarbamoyladenylate synthase [Chitinophagales bacterium]|nr:L-threonylcarbamoyladenylate synthase [Chitinophagales bacterium]